MTRCFGQCTCCILLSGIFQLIIAIFSALALAVATEEDQTKNINYESSDTYIYHAVNFFNLVVVRQSLNRLDEDGEAESDEEHGVDESTEHFSTCPAVRVLS